MSVETNPELKMDLELSKKYGFIEQKEDKLSTISRRTSETGKRWWYRRLLNVYREVIDDCESSTD